MKAKFSQTAVELAVQCPNNLQEMCLMGTEPLCEYNEFVKQAIANNDIDCDCCFDNIFGDEDGFLYVLEKYRKISPQEEELVLYERGVGSIKVVDDQKILHRDISICWGNSANDKFNPNGRFISFTCEEQEYVIATSVYPLSYAEALLAPYTVVTSQCEPFLPEPVQIQENSLLGRKDGCIDSIDMEEFATFEGLPNAIVAAIAKSQKQIKLKARRLDLDRKNATVSAPILRAAPEFSDSDKPPAQTGSIIYNTDSNCLEFYDGQKWRALVWKDENEDTT